MAISETGIWGEEEALHHQHSEALLLEMNAIIYSYHSERGTGYHTNKIRVYDFGCGLGFYVNGLYDEGRGYNAYGIEGRILKNCVCKDRILQFDLTKPFDLTQGHVICLEVGEHIPEQYEQHLIDHIAKTCNGMLFLSWALPNQPGIGHVNCKPQDYIISEICRRGFTYKEELTKEVRGTIEEHTSWFRRTLLIFERI